MGFFGWKCLEMGGRRERERLDGANKLGGVFGLAGLALLNVGRGCLNLFFDRTTLQLLYFLLFFFWKIYDFLKTKLKNEENDFCTPIFFILNVHTLVYLCLFFYYLFKGQKSKNV